MKYYERYSEKCGQFFIDEQGEVVSEKVARTNLVQPLGESFSETWRPMPEAEVRQWQARSEPRRKSHSSQPADRIRMEEAFKRRLQPQMDLLRENQDRGSEITKSTLNTWWESRASLL